MKFKLFSQTLFVQLFLNELVLSGLIDAFRNCFYTEDICPNQDINFWLYSKETENTPIKLNVTNLNSAHFIPKKPLKILIHGYTGSRDIDPNPQIRPILLEEIDTYVISVDYEPLVQVPCYIQGVENIKTVAKCLGNLINTLIDQNLVDNDDIHLIGFSLGAQTAGMTSNYVNTKLHHITGLDPAKPLFILADSSNKLDKSDAEFVDVIHTDVLQRGVLLQAGHVDFYPNAGLDQPGCDLQNFTSQGSCNHARAPEYYAESIISEIRFYGYSCPNWFSYMVGLCRTTNSTSSELMGYNVSREARGVYFLLTNWNSPFALGHNYQSKSLITLPDGLAVDRNFVFNNESLNVL